MLGLLSRPAQQAAGSAHHCRGLLALLEKCRGYHQGPEAAESGTSAIETPVNVVTAKAEDVKKVGRPEVSTRIYVSAFGSLYGDLSQEPLHNSAAAQVLPILHELGELRNKNLAAMGLAIRYAVRSFPPHTSI